MGRARAVVQNRISPCIDIVIETGREQDPGAVATREHRGVRLSGGELTLEINNRTSRITHPTRGWPPRTADMRMPSRKGAATSTTLPSHRAVWTVVHAAPPHSTLITHDRSPLLSSLTIEARRPVAARLLRLRARRPVLAHVVARLVLDVGAREEVARGAP